MGNNNTLFRSLVDSSPAGMYLTDADGSCTYVNKSWCRMAGLEPHEALGRGWINGIYPGDRDKIREQWSQLVEGSGTFGLEYRFQDCQGNITWVYGAASRYYNGNEDFIGYIGTNIDITERKQAEEVIREKSCLQEVLLGSIPAITMLIRHDTKEVLACNKAAERVGVIVGETCYRSRHKKSTPCPSCLANELLTTGKPQYLQTCENGCCWDSSWVPVTDDLYLFYSYDNIEQKKNEQALRDSEKYLKMAQEIAHIGHWKLDPETNTLIVSDEMLRIFGLTPETELLDAFADTVHPDDFEFVMANVKGAVENAKPYAIKHRLRLADGKEKTVYVKGHPVTNDAGKTILLMGTLQDVTEREEIEKVLLEYHTKLQIVASELVLAEEKQQKKIAGELHDGVCQLLVSCKMSLGKLKNSLEDQAAVHHVNEISNTIDLAIKKTRTLTFDLANPILFELGPCQAIDDLAQSYLQEKYNITAHVKCGDAKCKDLSLHLTDDLKMVIYRAVRELFVNIVKHAHASVVDVTLFLKDDNLRIEVTDDGIGFDYVSEASNRKPGKKIGLFIMMERLAYFGGHLDFEFGRGKGTKAVIEIPLP